VNPDDPAAHRLAHGRFNTTRWSVVLSCVDADGGTQKMHTALAELCKIYWRPVFAFIRRLGHSPQDAQDLTQDFFVMCLKVSFCSAPIQLAALPFAGAKALEDFFARCASEAFRAETRWRRAVCFLG
jgi:hypothetical protein